MSDDTAKAASAWPQPPAPRGRCHVRILVQDSVGLTSEVVIPCADWNEASKLQAEIRQRLTPTPTSPAPWGRIWLTGEPLPPPTPDTPELAEYKRRIMAPCPTCGSPAGYSCDNDDPLANHCPLRAAPKEPGK